MPTAPAPIISGARNDQLQKILRFGGQRPFIPNKLSALDTQKGMSEKQQLCLQGGNTYFQFCLNCITEFFQTITIHGWYADYSLFLSFLFYSQWFIRIVNLHGIQIGLSSKKKALEDQLQLEMYNCVLLALLFQISDYDYDWMWRLDRTNEPMQIKAPQNPAPFV